MNILSISLDKRLLETGSVTEDSVERHIHYHHILKDMSKTGSLHILIRGSRSQKQQLSFNKNELYLHPVGSSSSAFLVNTLQIGRMLLQQQKFDLIITQTPFLDGVAGVLLKKQSDIPLLVQLHTSFLDNPNWLTESLVNPLRRQIGLWTFAHADAIRVVSAQAAEWARAKFPSSSIYLVPVSITLKLPTKYTPPESPIILFVGRFVWQKNVDLLIRAFARVWQILPQASLVLVGDGPERRSLEKLAAKLLPQLAVTFTGAIPYHKLSDYYRRAMVLVVPSRYEPYGRVFLEGLGHGCPVIGTESEGAKMLLQDEFGIVVPQDDEDTLVEKLVQLLQAPDRARQMGQQAWSWVHNNYSSVSLQIEWVRTWIKTATKGNKYAAVDDHASS